MPGLVWPMERMTEALGGRLSQSGPEEFTIRFDNPELGVKLKLNIDRQRDDIRLLVDRTGKRRPTFVASLVLDRVAGVEVRSEHREIDFMLADGQRLVISASCTFRLYRPA